MKFQKSSDGYEYYDSINKRAELRKKNKYERLEDEEGLRDELDDLQDEISQEFLGMYGIHNVTKSIPNNGVMVYTNDHSKISEEVKKSMQSILGKYKLIIKESKHKGNDLDKVLD
jgi:hypothetical protein